MALGSTQPLTEMSTSSISWGKKWPVRRLTILPPSWATVTQSGNLNFLESSGHLGPVLGLMYLFFKINCTLASCMSKTLNPVQSELESDDSGSNRNYISLHNENLNRVMSNQFCTAHVHKFDK